MAFAARACQCGTVDCARYSKAAKIFPLTNRAERTAGKWDPASPAPGLGSCTPSLPVQKGGSLPTDRKQSGACPRYRSNVGWRLHSPRPRGAVANGGSWGGCVDNAGSCGGVVTSGLAIYDTMQFVRPAVSTLCVGQAASMASLLLAAGQKDMRFALPNSRITASAVRWLPGASDRHAAAWPPVSLPLFQGVRFGAGRIESSWSSMVVFLVLLMPRMTMTCDRRPLDRQAEELSELPSLARRCSIARTAYAGDAHGQEREDA